jgi:hypothetical protein
MSSFAKSAVPTTVRIMGIVAVSRNDKDSGTWTKMSSFFLDFFFDLLIFYNSVTLLFSVSVAPSRDTFVCKCLPHDITAFPNPKPIPPYMTFQDQ